MAQVVVTLKIMPEGVDTDFSTIEEEATRLISEFGGKVGKTEYEPIAFGLKALNLLFIMNEDIGSTEALEEDIKKLEGVGSAEVTDVRRTIG